MKISANKEVLLKRFERFAKEKLSFSDGKLYEAGTELVAIHVARTANILFLLDDKKYHKWANEALENCRFYMCHMTPMYVSRLYLEFNDKLTERAKERIVEYLRSVRDEYTGDELDFVGVNDNFPMMSTYAAVAMYKIPPHQSFHKSKRCRLP